MTKVTFREERCMGCELCVHACPQRIVTMAKHINAGGFHPATVVQQDKCTGCAMCALMCPDVVIEVEREEKQ
ncbi:MAG: 4Fe-4S binding protein [Clostridia bacterium]|nr:4Fe-4S binding protein [Clostridia bacterium]